MDIDSLIRGLGGTAKVAEACRVSDGAVSLWKRRGSIPSGHWPGLARLAREVGRPDVTFEVIASLNGCRAEPAEARA